MYYFKRKPKKKDKPLPLFEKAGIKVKKKPDLKAKLDKEFSLYIRLRDSKPYGYRFFKCISCGELKPFEKGEGGRFGLGLSIVAKVVRANHYEVRGENTADGVIFRIYRDQPKKAKQKTERRSRQRGAKNNNEA